MQRLTLVLVLTLITSLICVTAWAVDKPAADKKTEIKATTEKKVEVKTTTMAKEKVEVLNPDDNLKKAKESFLKKDNKTAAAEIRKAAEAMKIQAKDASAEAKDALTASIAELDKLAAEMEKSSVTSMKVVNDDFARADHAIAKNYYMKAMEFSAKKNTKAAGMELKSASDGLERGFAWTGMKIEKATTDTIQASRTVAGKMMEGAAVTAEEANKSMKNISVEIDKLEKLVMPAKGKEIEKKKEIGQKKEAEPKKSK
jgi:hypothetical protein